jgi:hypothetical protein
MINISHFIVHINKNNKNGLYTGFVTDYPNQIYTEASSLGELYDNIRDVLKVTNGVEDKDLPELVGIFI